jgi:hypothetical protein
MRSSSSLALETLELSAERQNDWSRRARNIRLVRVFPRRRGRHRVCEPSSRTRVTPDHRIQWVAAALFGDQDSFVQDGVTPQHRRGLAGRRGINRVRQHFCPQRPDCVAGHVRLELRNVVTNYPLESSIDFREINPNSSRRDNSRLSCDLGICSSGLVPSQ